MDLLPLGSLTYDLILPHPEDCHNVLPRFKFQGGKKSPTEDHFKATAKLMTFHTQESNFHGPANPTYDLMLPHPKDCHSSMCCQGFYFLFLKTGIDDCNDT